MNKHFIALTILMIVAFTSCKKEAIEPASSLQSLQDASGNRVVAEGNSSTFTVVDNQNGTFTATLQPDDTNGQDVHVYKRNGSPEIANENFNTVPELDISAWTYFGSPIFLRVYLRFDDLAKIPSTAHVLSATLYLYGLSSSIVSPQGNYGDNRCIIEPVTGPWDESTLTWNTQPKVSDKFHVTIPASTSQWNYNVALDDVKAMVTRAVKYPDRNFGVRISLAEEFYYRNMVFASSESSDPAKRPKLVVVYE